MPDANRVKRVLFLISPHWGLFDNWAPVLSELRKERPEIKITAVFPKPGMVGEIDPREITARLGQHIFSEVVFKSQGGAWVWAENLFAAQALLSKRGIVAFLLKKKITILRRVFRENSAMRRMVEMLVLRLIGERQIDFREWRTEVRAICFDIFAKTKQECWEIFAEFPEAARFSIPHGLTVSDFAVPGGDSDRGAKGYRTTAYLYSNHEILAYRKNYGLKENEVKVVGVPRHEPRWIAKVQEESKRDFPESWDRYIFLVSRPATPDFFPVERKEKALADLKRLAFDDLKCRIVVRRHPTEMTEKGKDGLCEKVFGERGYGDRWIYSSAHPFSIGAGSMFVVTFYSGVVLDMLALRIPSIELADLSGPITKKTGGVDEGYQKRGLVLGANNYEELKKYAHAIAEDRNVAVESLLVRYKEFFSSPHDSIRVISSDILSVL